MWGAEILRKIKPLKEKVTELKIALEQHLNPELRTKEKKDLDSIIYNRGTDIEDDEFGAEVTKSIDAINDFIKSKLRVKK